MYTIELLPEAVKCMENDGVCIIELPHDEPKNHTLVKAAFNGKNRLLRVIGIQDSDHRSPIAYYRKVILQKLA